MVDGASTTFAEIRFAGWSMYNGSNGNRFVRMFPGHPIKHGYTLILWNTSSRCKLRSRAIPSHAAHTTGVWDYNTTRSLWHNPRRTFDINF